MKTGSRTIQMDDRRVGQAFDLVCITKYRRYPVLRVLCEEPVLSLSKGGSREFQRTPLPLRRLQPFFQGLHFGI
jgi:hypothetical protein